MVAPLHAVMYRYIPTVLDPLTHLSSRLLPTTALNKIAPFPPVAVGEQLIFTWGWCLEVEDVKKTT